VPGFCFAPSRADHSHCAGFIGRFRMTAIP
jgi:hypothetical protein